MPVFPPPPPPTEISLLELPPKMPSSHPGTEAAHVKELELWPSVLSLPPVQTGSEVGGTDEDEGPVNNSRPTKPPSPPSSPNAATPSPPPPPPPQPDPMTDVRSPAPVEPDSPQTPGKLSLSPGKEAPPLPTKPKPKL